MSERDDLRRLVTEAVVRALAEEARGDAAPSPAPARPAPAASPSPTPPRAGAPAPRGKPDAAAARPREFPEPQHERGPRWLRSHAGSLPRRGRDRDDAHDDGEAHWGLRDLPPPPDEATIHVERPRDPEALRRYVRSTPSRIAVGRTGTRYLTETYLRMRADHAVAKDAVESDLREGFAAELGALEVRTRCKDREDFLLFPENGRRLDDASRALLEREGSRGADVQVIIGDGLSAWAVHENGPLLAPRLDAALRAAGWSTGRPIVVRFARVGVQDEIGTLLGNKATIILVGERPGLGTGDSMSIYIAYGPKPAQDNAEKNCISNVRRLGIQTDEAVRLTVGILKGAFAAGRGGVAAQ